MKQILDLFARHFPAEQIIRYVLVGLAASAIHAAVFAVLNHSIFPAGDVIDGAVRGSNYVRSNIVAFVFSSIFTYWQNRRWVFRSDSPGIVREIVLFYLVAGLAWTVGTALGAWIVSGYAVNEYAVLILTIGTSTVVNFTGRKWLVFASGKSSD